MGHKVEFIVNSHSEVVNGFVNQVREAYQKLNLFGPEHCEPNSWEDLDYAGKVLVLSPEYSERILLDTGKSALVCP